MPECDRCGASAEVWKHRESSPEMTHRRIEWLCADCHPSLLETPSGGAP